MSHSWLARQRKQQLLDLSADAGFPQTDELRKDDIIEALQVYLEDNERRLSRNPAFEGYYGSRFQDRAPTVAERVEDAVEEVKSVVKGRRRTTKIKSEPEDSDGIYSPVKSVKKASSSALTSAQSALTQTTHALTPSSSQTTRRRVSSIPGPPSPSALADAVELETNKLISSASDLYAQSGITDFIDNTRQTFSSVEAVQLTFLLIEAFAVQRTLLPLKEAFDLPQGVGRTTVYLPDLFQILTKDYWLASLLWVASSIAIPSLFAYFYNLTLREVKRGGARVSVVKYTVDPLMFNIVKALLSYLVYGPAKLGRSYLDAKASDTIDQAVYGGYHGVMVGCGVGVLASLYDAALKK